MSSGVRCALNSPLPQCWILPAPAIPARRQQCGGWHTSRSNTLHYCSQFCKTSLLLSSSKTWLAVQLFANRVVPPLTTALPGPSPSLQCLRQLRESQLALLDAVASPDARGVYQDLIPAAVDLTKHPSPLHLTVRKGFVDMSMLLVETKVGIVLWNMMDKAYGWSRLFHRRIYRP